ncbi:MAG: hypothetical protein JNN13_17990 [Planctomycetes bacterium]|nr:hypothetical protein [Planctomycetota bacterium]
MMMLQRSRFLHLPKTGGTWVRHALQAGCPGARWCLLDGSDHLRWWEAPGRGLFTVAFVRHPLTWWQSFWRFHRGPARRYVVSQRVCQHCWSDDFVQFVGNVTQRFPGEYGLLLDNFLGPAGAAVDFLGRQEHLVDDLLLALRLADEPHDEAAIRAVSAANVSAPETVATYTAAGRKAVLGSEQYVLQRCGYDGRVAQDQAMAQHWLAPAVDYVLPRGNAAPARCVGQGR